MDSGEFDHTDRAIAGSIYEWIAERRAECPVLRSSRFGGFWAVFDYDDVIVAAHDAEHFSSAGEIDIPNIGTAVKSYPLQADPPEHAKYRRLLQPYFTPAAVGQFAPTIRKVVVQRLEQVVPRGQAEVVSELAQPIPATAIALLLGIDEDRWRDLQVWTKGMLEATIAGDLERAKHSGHELFEFLVGEIEARKRGAERRPPDGDHPSYHRGKRHH